MRIGLLTDSLSRLPLLDALDAAAELDIETIELATGNWSQAPHVDLRGLLADSAKRDALRDAVAGRGLEIEALNCSGNPLHPVSGIGHSAVTRDTIRLAGELGIDTVVLMSGLPAARGDSAPNWVTTCWPPEVSEILEYQWEDVAIPFWSELVDFAGGHGVTKLALELHPHQLVFNVRSFERMRAAVGVAVGVNFDPSHLMWMGADPFSVIRALGDAIYHVHAKDTRIEAAARVNSTYEVLPFDDVENRSWNYVTLGRGMPDGATYWRQFVDELRAVGYTGVLSIEHEDVALGQVEGVTESVDVLRSALAVAPAPALA